MHLPKSVATLTPTETAILALLVEGNPYKEIALKLGKSESCIHNHTNHIRKKTGIHHTYNQKECAAALVRLKTEEVAKPTPKQMEVLILVANGWNYKQIGEALEMSHQTAQNHASHGCKRVGIHNPYGRTTAIRAYLDRLEAGEGKAGGSPMDDPLF